MTAIVAMYGNAGKLSDIYNRLGVSVVSITTEEEALSVPYTRVLLRGGADISPRRYRQKPMYSYGVDETRDSVEWLMTQVAVENEFPILGICRGMQLLNVFFGGTLYQDVSLVTLSNHFVQSHELDWHIPVRGFPCRISSRHHQAVKKLGTPFQVLAYSLDGIVECIYTTGMLGVQGHPEDTISEWENLFRWHVAGFKRRS